MEKITQILASATIAMGMTALAVVPRSHRCPWIASAGRHLAHRRQIHSESPELWGARCGYSEPLRLQRQGLHLLPTGQAPRG